jgi:hypothetical protein
MLVMAVALLSRENKTMDITPEQKNKPLWLNTYPGRGGEVVLDVIARIPAANSLTDPLPLATEMRIPRIWLMGFQELRISRDSDGQVRFEVHQKVSL